MTVCACTQLWHRSFGLAAAQLAMRRAIKGDLLESVLVHLSVDGAIQVLAELPAMLVTFEAGDRLVENGGSEYHP